MSDMGCSGLGDPSGHVASHLGSAGDNDKEVAVGSGGTSDCTGAVRVLVTVIVMKIEMGVLEVGVPTTIPRFHLSFGWSLKGTS